MSTSLPVPAEAAVIHDSGDTCGGVLTGALTPILAPLPAGAMLLLLNTDPAAPVDLRVWAKSQGHTFLGETVYEGLPGYFIRKGPDTQ